MAIDVTYGGAALAGLISFLSPCVLPLVPPYLCYMAGVSLNQLTGEGEARFSRRRMLLLSVAFVLGFTTVFVALGATASAFGQFVRGLFAYEFTLPFVLSGGQPITVSAVGAVAGLVIIVMGLHFLGVFRIGLLNREARAQVGQRAAGPGTAYLMGLAFAFGWTPCIGPVLAAILGIAGTTATVTHGASLLAAYSLGLGVPFVLAGLFAGAFMRFLKRFRSHLGAVEKTMGGLLVLTGILFITGGMATISYWLLDAFPGLASIG